MTTPDYPALPKPALSVSGFKDLFHEDQMRDYVQSDRAARAGDAEPVEMSPQFTDTSRAALLWVLWHHQGASSAIGGAMRFALGMGQHDRLSESQLNEAKRWAAIAAPQAPERAQSYLQPGDLAALARFHETAQDDDTYDIGKSSVKRLAELGAVRSEGFGRYSITSFGRLCLGESFSRLPLECLDDCNTRLGEEHAAALTLAASREGGAK